MKIILNIEEIPAVIIQKVLKEEYNINTAIYDFIEDADKSTIELQKNNNSAIAYWERVLLIIPIDTNSPDIILWQDVCHKDSKYLYFKNIDFMRSSTMLISIIEEQQNQESWKFDNINGSPCIIEIPNGIDYEILTQCEFDYEYGVQQKTPKWTILDKT